MNNENNEVHVHEIIQMMMDSGVNYTRETLRAAIIERFGPDARFATCGSGGLTVEECIDFLIARGKFVDSASGFTAPNDLLCGH
jgi:probable metal-binding protein